MIYIIITLNVIKGGRKPCGTQAQAGTDGSNAVCTARALRAAPRIRGRAVRVRAHARAAAARRGHALWRAQLAGGPRLDTALRRRRPAARVRHNARRALCRPARARPAARGGAHGGGNTRGGGM